MDSEGMKRAMARPEALSIFCQKKSPPAAMCFTMKGWAS